MPKIKISIHCPNMLNTKLKDAMSDPITSMDKESIEHFELLVNLAKSDKHSR